MSCHGLTQLQVAERAGIVFGGITPGMHFDIDAPDATPRQIDALQRATEQYCVVLQTLQVPPQIEAYWHEDVAATGS